MDLNKTIIKLQDLDMGKFTINPGIEDPNSQGVIWEPGDGCRYTVLFNILPESLMLMMGGTKNHVLVTFYNGQEAHSWAMIDGGYHATDYVAARFGLEPNQSTAAYLSALLNLTVGQFDYGVELYKGAKERWT